jgi:hypothetical protein
VLTIAGVLAEIALQCAPMHSHRWTLSCSLFLFTSLACERGNADSDAIGEDSGQTAATGEYSSQACNAYLECVAEVAPSALGEAAASFGPNGSCWDIEMPELCSEACEAALTDLQRDFGACGGAETTTTTGSGNACLDEVPSEGTDGQTEPLMERWGAACQTNEECVELLGAGAICESAAVIYELPGGYCTKPCDLGGTGVTVVPDHPDCDAEGGVDCVGQRPLFELCARPCDDSAQCDRTGYYCRQMPALAQPGDPSYCLMPDCCENTCAWE